MTTPIWKLVGKAADGVTDVVSRTWPDGRGESCLVISEEYLKWLALGNTPDPADPKPVFVLTKTLEDIISVLTDEQKARLGVHG